jgi:hypothetical protein
MFGIRRCTFFLAACVSRLVAGCGGSTPTSPSPAAAAAAAVPSTASQANVSSVLPTSPPPSDAVQTLVVDGNNFKPGLTVTFRPSGGDTKTLTMPNGSTTTVSGSGINFASSTLFNMLVVLADAGTYSVKVTNPSGQTSNSFTFTVKAVEPPAPQVAPTITRVSPNTPTQSTVAQHIYLGGTNFVTGLTVTLTLPNGTSSTISSSAIAFGNSTVFNMQALLATAGSYSVKVTNPSGQASNVFAFTVK